MRKWKEFWLLMQKGNRGSDEKKILIVDDNEEFRKLIAEFLNDTQEEVNLIETGTGEEAIRLAQDEKPDLILMDIMMPGMNGGDVVKLLKNDKHTIHIPVIFLTGMYSENDEMAEEKINIDGKLYDSIAKPIDRIKLITAVNKYI